MEAQISFEFLVYLGLMAAGMVVALSLFSSSYPALRAGLSRDYLEGFLGSVYAHLGSGSTRFYGYVPAGLCGGEASENATLQDMANLSGVKLLVDNSVCSGGGAFGWLGLDPLTNGTFLLREG